MNEELARRCEDARGRVGVLPREDAQRSLTHRLQSAIDLLHGDAGDVLLFGIDLDAVTSGSFDERIVEALLEEADAYYEEARSRACSSCTWPVVDEAGTVTRDVRLCEACALAHTEDENGGLQQDDE